MRSKIAIAFLVLAFLLPRPAQALENEELLALVAMPLAVAAVSEITDVPMNDLFSVVSMLNEAEVAPSQFIEVVRYVPVALVVESEPRFVEYVRVRRTEGLTGTRLVTLIEDRYRDYGLRDIDLDAPAIRIVEVDTRTFVPPIVRTRMAEIRAGHPHGGPPGQLKKDSGMQTGAQVVHGSHPGKSGDDGRGRAVVRERDDDGDRGRAGKPDKPKGRSDSAARGGKGNDKGKGKGKG